MLISWVTISVLPLILIIIKLTYENICLINKQKEIKIL